MKFRSRLFGFLALLSLLWICYGVFVSSSAFSTTVNSGATTIPNSSLDAEEQQAIRAAGAGLGAGLGLTIFLCTGLPFLALFGLLSWRNSVGLRREQMHKEQIEALKSNKQ